ncbi:hypothetical protein VTI28DRAFT_5495 [Corynascus sepedonium]
MPPPSHFPPLYQRRIIEDCRSILQTHTQKKREKKRKKNRHSFIKMFRRRRAVIIDKPGFSLRDRNERQRKADEDDELFHDADNNDKRVVNKKAQEERICAWQSMQYFVETFKKHDFDQIWLGLCRDDPKSKAVIRSYFRDYVESSQTTRPILGEKEYEVVQTITTTRTVISRWKNLVAEADNTILRDMRRKDPDNWGLWKLRWDQGEPSDRPVADISNVRTTLLPSQYLSIEVVSKMTKYSIVDP